ncbi:MAG TPA: tetratricopeptide repeat protein [Armatimonadota bacterium]
MYDNQYNQDGDQQLQALIESGQFDQALAILQEWYDREPWNGEILMRMAVVHWLSGQPAMTLRDLDAYLVMDPDNAEALSRRAQVLLMLGKHEDAEAALSRAETLDPTTPGVLLNRALIAEEHKDYEAAITAISAYLEALPQDHLALARRSHLQRQVGRYAQALDDALACQAIRPDDPESHFAEALARVTLEQGEEALAACDRCLQLQPSYSPARRLKIDLLADLGRLDEAERELKILQDAEPSTPHTALLLARMLAERGEFAGALEWIDRYLDDYPDEGYGYYRRGMIYFRMADYERALRDFQEYARLSPLAVEAYEQQFMCYLELGLHRDAAAVGKTAAELQPQNFRLVYNLAFAELLCGHVEQATTGFKLALQLNPANEELVLRIYQGLAEFAPAAVLHDWLREGTSTPGPAAVLMKGLLAEFYLERGQIIEALQLTNEVITEDQSRPFGYLLAIRALMLLDRLPEALIIAQRGVTVLPDDGRLRLAHALVLRDLGEADEALQELSMADQLMPGDPEVVRQQALVYGSTGDVPRAVSLLEHALALEDTNADTYFWLGYFLTHRRRYQEALAASERILTLLPGSMEGHLIRGVALRGLRRHGEADKELAQVRTGNPALLERVGADPVIAELLKPPQPRRLRDRMRRSVSRYLHINSPAAGDES